MDTYLAITSKRDTRSYAERELPADAVDRILDAGRLAGSTMNRQPWRFVVVESELRDRLAETVFVPENVRGAKLVVAVAEAKGFDAGRCAQNMMLAAWNDGIASCPNGIADGEAAKSVLDLEEPPATVLTFGYPARHPGAESRPAEEWSARANRLPLDQLVQRV